MNEDGTYNLSETQARAILDLRLQRLTAMGVKEVTDELQDLAAKIKDYLDILARITSTFWVRASGSWRSSRTSCAR